MKPRTCINCNTTIDAPPEVAKYARYCDSCIEKSDAETRIAEARRVHANRIATLPKKWQGITWNDCDGRYPATEAACKKWAVSGGRLLLLGPVGGGKSHLAAAAANARMAVESVLWVPAAATLLNLNAAFTSESRAHALAAITGKSAAVIDDLDKTGASEWAKAQLFAAIETRLTAEANLIITSNATPETLKSKLGEAIASRLIGECEVHVIDGPDRRLAA